MKLNQYLTICNLNIYKNLSKTDKHFYLILDKFHCTYKNLDWIYKSRKDLAVICGLSERTITRCKKNLQEVGLIKTKKYYNYNGNRGSDSYHLNSLQDILKFLIKNQKAIKQHQKDLNCLTQILQNKNRLSDIAVSPRLSDI